MIQSQTEHQTVSKWLTNYRSFTANCGQKLENKKSGNYFHIKMKSIIMLDGKIIIIITSKIDRVITEVFIRTIRPKTFPEMEREPRGQAMIKQIVM